MKKSMYRPILMALVLSAAMVTQACNSKQKAEDKQTEESTQMIEVDVIRPDVYKDSEGNELLVTLIGHGSLSFQYRGKMIYVDPYSQVADYAKLPKADLIILTHDHSDHLDPAAIDKVKKSDTRFVMSAACAEQLGYGETIANGGSTLFDGVAIAAYPAYNIVHKMPNGTAYHPKGRGNGYLFTFGNLKVYVAGDTENIPELATLGALDIAFLPKNLPYTMNDEMFVDAAKKTAAKVLYPYHFSEFDEAKIKAALNSTKTQIIVKPMSNLGK